MNPSQTELGLAAASAAALSRPELVTKLVVLAQRIGHRQQYVTVCDLRLEAIAEGLLPEKGEKRELSFLGAVMKKAGFLNTGRTERSRIPGTNGNRNTVWSLHNWNG